MKIPFSSVLIIGLCMTLVSCSEEEHPPKLVGTFQTIYCNGSVTFNFVQGVENALVSTTVDDNHYNVNDDQLFVNSSGGIMTVSIYNLDSFWCNGCDIENTGPLIQDTLDLELHAGSVELNDLQINSIFHLKASNTGTYKLSGQATFFKVNAVNTSRIQAFNMVTDSTHINSGSLDCEVYATQVLDAVLQSTGNVYYMGDPPIVRVSGFGLGKAIKKE